MSNFHADVHVELKPLVNDPAGLVIRDALHNLGFPGVRGVRAGKYLSVELEAGDQAEAEARVREMCQKLLSNPVIEEFRLEVREATTA
ncbi:MAG: phosphoribosylformylglycinamidine synthase subunit PurS [Candidatus Dormibacteraeota bacterium]|nr:phosphoribosylformylglycinamidine synthase subunit PurS [Candidatus Dormibacteraeota bacterium]